MTDDRLQQIASHTISEMAVCWELMTKGMTEQMVQSVRMVMSARTPMIKEMKDIETLLELETNVGQYTQLTARYLKVFRDLVRLSVTEVRFGVKK